MMGPRSLQCRSEQIRPCMYAFTLLSHKRVSFNSTHSYHLSTDLGCDGSIALLVIPLITKRKSAASSILLLTLASSA